MRDVSQNGKICNVRVKDVGEKYRFFVKKGGAKCNILIIFNPIRFRYRKYHRTAAVLAGDLPVVPGVTDGAETGELPLDDLPPPPTLA